MENANELMNVELRCLVDSMYNIVSLYNDLSDEKRALFDKYYPFDKSFDELANDVMNWIESV